jgi:hypothetical protein
LPTRQAGNHPGEDPLDLGAALGRTRGVSPIGVLAHGAIERIARRARIPLQSSEIVGRMSGIGTPVTCRRSRDSRGGCRRCFEEPPMRWLIASAIRRVALLPVRTWSGATLSSLIPLQGFSL